MLCCFWLSCSLVLGLDTLGAFLVEVVLHDIGQARIFLWAARAGNSGGPFAF